MMTVVAGNCRHIRSTSGKASGSIRALSAWPVSAAAANMAA
jgi:hypothetical protein